MSTFRAEVRVDEGMLHTSRPLTAPTQVADLIESVVYQMREAAGGDVTSVQVVVETSGGSETPVGDSITATSSEPIDANAEVPDAEVPDAEVPDEAGADGEAGGPAMVAQPAMPSVPGRPV